MLGLTVLLARTMYLFLSLLEARDNAMQLAHTMHLFLSVLLEVRDNASVNKKDRPTAHTLSGQLVNFHGSDFLAAHG